VIGVTGFWIALTTSAGSAAMSTLRPTASARRAVLVTLKDAAESVFDLDHHRAYRRRVEAVCDCRPFELARYGDHVGGVRLFMEFELIRAGAEQMTRERARRLSREFGVTHIVVRASQPATDLGGWCIEITATPSCVAPAPPLDRPQR
jgi:hypothetical protein